MHADPLSVARLGEIELVIDAWLREQLDENPVIEEVVRDTETDGRRWFVRVTGEQKAVFSVWFHLRQRTLSVETYVMPAPEENQAALYEQLLRRNQKMFGFAFSIGVEDAVFLVGQIPSDTVTSSELDRLLGSAYEYTEASFRPAMRIGFASKFTD